MAISRILDASRMRVNSLGPEAAGCTAGSFGLPGNWAGAGGAAGIGGAAQAGAVASGAGSLGAEREAKVCVQAPGSAPRGGLTGAASTRAAGAFEGSSSI